MVAFPCPICNNRIHLLYIYRRESDKGKSDEEKFKNKPAYIRIKNLFWCWTCKRVLKVSFEK